MCIKLNLNITKEKLIYLYFDKKLNINQIGNLYNCSRKPINRLIKEFNLKTRTKLEATRIRQPRKLDSITKKQLYNLYVVEKLTGTEIADMYNCSYPIVYNQLRKYNIPIRDSKECIKDIKRYGKNNPNYKDGSSSFLSILRGSNIYKNWRITIFKRDNYTCQKCNKVSIGNIEAHHKYPMCLLLSDFLKKYDIFSQFKEKEILLRLATKYKPFWDLNNGQTLCEDCHKEEFIKTMEIIKGGN